LFLIQGSQGELFSVTDNLSGSLFSVNDISGLPVVEVFSDSTTLIGNYQAPSLYTTARSIIGTGSQVIYQVSTASYDGLFVDYTVKSGSHARVGHIRAMWSGSSISITETSSSAFVSGSTWFNLGVIVTGSYMALTGSSASGSSWTIKTIVRAI